VEQAEASVTLANVTDARTATLAGQGWASKQNADQTRAGMLTATASLAAAQAKVKVAEANITAQQAIHNARTFHILFRILYSNQLILRLFIRKHFLKFLLPDRILPILIAMVFLTRGI